LMWFSIDKLPHQHRCNRTGVLCCCAACYSRRSIKDFTVLSDHDMEALWCLTVQDLQPSSFFRKNETWPVKFPYPRLGTSEMSAKTSLDYSNHLAAGKALATFSFDRVRKPLALIKLHQALSPNLQSLKAKECNYRQIKSELLDLYQQWEEQDAKFLHFLSPGHCEDEAISQRMLFEIFGAGKLLQQIDMAALRGMMVDKMGYSEKESMKLFSSLLQQSDFGLKYLMTNSMLQTHENASLMTELRRFDRTFLRPHPPHAKKIFDDHRLQPTRFESTSGNNPRLSNLKDKSGTTPDATKMIQLGRQANIYLFDLMEDINQQVSGQIVEKAKEARTPTSIFPAYGGPLEDIRDVYSQWFGYSKILIRQRNHD
jgi:hypothetical protein